MIAYLLFLRNSNINYGSWAQKESGKNFKGRNAVTCLRFSLATNLPTLHCSSKKSSKMQDEKFECWGSTPFLTFFFLIMILKESSTLWIRCSDKKKNGTTIGISTFHSCKLCETKWQMFSCKAPQRRDWIETDPTHLQSYWTASLVQGAVLCSDFESQREMQWDWLWFVCC